MGQATRKARSDVALKSPTSFQGVKSASTEADLAHQAHLARLKAEIAAGTYRVSAEGLAARLVRRIRWW